MLMKGVRFQLRHSSELGVEMMLTGVMQKLSFKIACLGLEFQRG
jgi:hypothetical protein